MSTAGHAAWSRRIGRASGVRRLRLSMLFVLALVGAAGLAAAMVVVAVDRVRPADTPFLVAPVLATLIALLVGNARRLLLGAILLEIPLQWDINLYWRQDIANLGANAGLNISVMTFALAGLYVVWTAELLSRTAPESRSRFNVRPCTPLAAYVAVTAASIIVASDTQLTMFEVALMGQLFLLFVYLVSTVTTPQDIRFIAIMLSVGLALESMLALLLYASGSAGGTFGLTGHLQGGTNQIGDRSGGTIGSANSAGSYFAAAIPVAVGTLALKLDRMVRAIVIAGVALGLVALVITLSRGGWLSLTASLVTLSIVGVSRGALRPRHVALGVAFLMIAFALLHGPILARVNGNDGGSASGRIPLLYLASDMIRAHPFTGVGGNNFAVDIHSYAGPDFSQDWLYIVHNHYLLTWAEAGIAALVSWIWFLVSPLVRGWRALRRLIGGEAVLLAAAMAALVGQMADMMLEPFQGRSQNELLLVIVALVICISQSTRGTQTGAGRAGARTASYRMQP
jgi:putative inorganic carbon (hco3(-)) transporter